MTMQEHLYNKLNQSLKPTVLDIINESHRHNTPPGAESHFKVTIVCPDFSGKSPVKRHQLIYHVLADELRSQIHALALHTYTPEEWLNRNQAPPSSPDCLGGSQP